MKKYSVIGKIVIMVEQHYKAVIMTMLVLIPAIQILVHCMYSVYPPLFDTEISADGMLSYLGSMAGGLFAVLAAILAIYQSRKEMDNAEEQSELQRRLDVCPRLQVELIKDSDNDLLFELTIVNCGEKSALDIYLYTTRYKAYLFPHELYRRKVSFDREMAEYYIDDEGGKFNDAGYPEYILICCRDIDNNLICHDFRISNGNGEQLIYELEDKLRYEED